MSAPPPPAGTDAVPSETLSYGREPSPDAGESNPDGSGLPRGSRVHRYTILDRVGQGGMGVVYAAYDPSLDRRVALKFLVTQEPARQSVREARLVREAQAMARLSHPNVAVVYEVGSFDGSVFLAMEFVDGVDLRAWLGEESRSLAQILDVFLGAGRGLAAAHAAGIVHRDFKPENVLLDEQDRPRVTDFGLSRSSHDVERADAEAIDDDLALRPASQLSTPLTRTGGMVGTPSYMAPEQHRGAEADARADQFAFCVALHEALYGVRPFAGATPAEIAEAIKQRRFDARSKATSSAVVEVPRWLRAVVVRGLEPRAEDRWPSMEALLAALSRDPRGARRHWMVGGGVVAGLIVTAALLVPPQEMEACPSARDRVATVWDSPTRAKVRAAFLATGSPIAPDIFSRVEQALDGRLDSWVAAHREACVATKVRGEQSEAMLDLRMQCLERARRQIAALPAAWSTDIKLEAALPTTHAAGELDACADPESLAAPEPHPRDPQKVKLLEALQRQLDELPALHGAGRIGVALPLARESVVKARQMSVPSVLAEALEWNARFELDFGNRDAGMPMLYEAFQAANEAHDDARASDVSRWLLYYGVRVLKQKDQADILWSMAEAAVSRVPTRQDLRAELLDTQGVVLWDQGKHADAIDHVQRAIELHEKVSPGDDYGRASMLDHLSTALADQGETKEAIATGKRALYALESALGEVAPKVAVSLQNLSLLETSIGDYEAAARSAQRGLDIRSTLFPGDHPEVAIALANLANVRMQEERLEEAMDLFQRSADIREKALGSDNPQLATVRNHLAWLAIRVGDTAKARRMIDLVLPVKRKAYGDQHRSTAYAYGVLGMVLLQEGEPAAARAAHEKELAIKLGHGDDHSFSVEALRNLAFVALFEGKPQQAIVHLERARAVVEQGDSADQARRFRLLTVLLYLGRAYVEAGRTSDAVSALRRAVELADENGVVSVNDGARARFELARATWTSGDHTGAVELATEAHDVLSAGPGSELVDWITGRSEVKTIQDWLRRHRTR